MSINFTPTPASEHQRRANWDHKYRHQNMSVDMDVWYPFLKSITFKTYFIPLKYREAEAVINFNYYRNKKQKDRFTKKDIQILRELEKKVDHFFETYDDLKNGAMFRLSGRSGKDMDYYDNKKIYALYQENLEKVSKKLGKDKTDINTKYVSITTLMNRFKVNCGKDVLNVLLTSERLFLDLKDWLQHGGREQMILRKWDDSLCSDKEFRAFIQNNELKAICQDERFALFQDLIDNKDLYEKLLNDYFKKALQPLMKIPNYIADFCILKNNEVKLIEFSPFLRCTSACLFRWDLNYEEMLHGTGKLTVREKVFDGLEFYVSDWEAYQSKPSDPFDNYFIEKEEEEEEEKAKEEEEKIEEEKGNSFIEKTKNFFSNLNPMKFFKKKDISINTTTNTNSITNNANTNSITNNNTTTNTNSINNTTTDTNAVTNSININTNTNATTNNSNDNNVIKMEENQKEQNVENNTNQETKKFENRKIFVVSVLKTGFFWSPKYITYYGSENKVLGKGVLENHTIYLDKNGFGWIKEKKGKKCYGEVIDVEYEDFLDVEFFYGQRDTTMQEITVKVDNKDVVVYAYIIKEIFDNVKNEEGEDKCEIEEYTMEIQNEKFNSMQHIINQQERYLNMSLDFDLKDSW